MMNYTPIANEYKGDDSVRAFTRANTTYRQNKKRKRQKKQISQQHSTNVMTVSSQAIQENIVSGRLHNLSTFQPHLNSKVYNRAKPRACFVCGKRTTTFCGICTQTVIDDDGATVERPVPLCFSGKSCFFDYHDKGHFGLCKGDYIDTGSLKSNWKEPSVNQVQEQTQYIDYCIGECTDQDININRTSTLTTTTSTSVDAGISPNTVDTATESDVNTHHENKNDDTNIGSIIADNHEWF